MVINYTPLFNIFIWFAIGGAHSSDCTLFIYLFLLYIFITALLFKIFIWRNCTLIVLYYQYYLFYFWTLNRTYYHSTICDRLLTFPIFVSFLTLVCNTFTPHPGANFALHCGILITFKLALQGSRLSQKRNLPGFPGSLLQTDEGGKEL